MAFKKTSNRIVPQCTSHRCYTDHRMYRGYRQSPSVMCFELKLLRRPYGNYLI